MSKIGEAFDRVERLARGCTCDRGEHDAGCCPGCNAMVGLERINTKYCRLLAEAVGRIKESQDTMKANIWHMENTLQGIAAHTRVTVSDNDAFLAKLEGGK